FRHLEYGESCEYHTNRGHLYRCFQSAHLIHDASPGSVNYPARGEEERCLEYRMAHELEQACRVSSYEIRAQTSASETHHHVSYLGDRRIRENLLDLSRDCGLSGREKRGEGSNPSYCSKERSYLVDLSK